jgi:hypothetical protein
MLISRGRLIRKGGSNGVGLVPHQSLERNSTNPREIKHPSQGKIIAMPQVGGLHHLYRRAA